MEAADARGGLDQASTLRWESLCALESGLIRELHTAELREHRLDLQLVFDGEPVQNHAVRASFFAGLVGNLQGLVNAIAQVMMGKPEGRAPKIVQEQALMISSLQPSSFSVQLHFPYEEKGLFVAQALETAAEMFDDIDDLHEHERLDDFISLVRNPKVKNCYEEILRTIDRNGAVVLLRTPGHLEGRRFSREEARARIEWLELHGAKEETLALSGVLAGGNVETSKYELLIDGEYVKGKASEHAADQMRHITFGADVKARIKVTTHYHEDEIVQSTQDFFLEDIEPA